MSDYNYDELNESDKQFVDGYKWCVEEAVDSFFGTLIPFDDDYLTHILNQELPEHMKDEYEIEHYSGDTETRKIETYADLLQARMCEWCDVQLAELLISLLDNYEEKEEDDE